MSLNKYSFWNPTGVKFSLVALLVTVLVYSVLAWRGTLGEFTFPLIFTGFGLPFFLGIFARGLAGCGLKDAGCALVGYLGFGIGVLVQMQIFYLIGSLYSRFIGKIRRR